MRFKSAHRMDDMGTCNKLRVADRWKCKRAAGAESAPMEVLCCAPRYAVCKQAQVQQFRFVWVGGVC